MAHQEFYYALNFIELDRFVLEASSHDIYESACKLLNKIKNVAIIKYGKLTVLELNLKITSLQI